MAQAGGHRCHTRREAVREAVAVVFKVAVAVAGRCGHHRSGKAVRDAEVRAQERGTHLIHRCRIQAVLLTLRRQHHAYFPHDRLRAVVQARATPEARHAHRIQVLVRAIVDAGWPLVAHVGEAVAGE